MPSVRMAGRELPFAGLSQIQGGFQSRFELPIYTWAGRTRVELRDGLLQHVIHLEVGPHEGKLGAYEFDEMLSELSRQNPILVWGLSPGFRTVEETELAPAIAHPAVIASQLPRFERLLALFIEDPPSSTKRIRTARPLEHSRRVDLGTLRWLGRRPVVLGAIRGDTRAGSLIESTTAVDQPLSILTHDHPVSRFVKHLLLRLSLRFGTSANTIRKVPGKSFHDPIISAHAEALAREMDEAAKRMKTAIAGPLFRNITPQLISETTYQWLADHPVFSGLVHTARKMLEPRLGYGPVGGVQSALKHTYDLFELFVLYRLLEQLESDLGADWKLEVGKTIVREWGESRPPDGAAWLYRGPDGLSLEVRYQQWFSRARMPPDGGLFTSLSGTNVPDYVLVLRRRGHVVSWLLLDAKYRSGQQAIDDGLNDVHRYRDALRVCGRPANLMYPLIFTRCRRPRRRCDFDVGVLDSVR